MGVSSSLRLLRPSSIARHHDQSPIRTFPLSLGSSQPTQVPSTSSHPDRQAFDSLAFMSASTARTAKDARAQYPSDLSPNQLQMGPRLTLLLSLPLLPKRLKSPKRFMLARRRNEWLPSVLCPRQSKTRLPDVDCLYRLTHQHTVDLTIRQRQLPCAHSQQLKKKECSSEEERKVV